MPTLFIYPDKGNPFSFEMPEAKIVIGRSPKNEVVLNDPCCSSYHASIFPTDRGYAVKDLGSKNGTYLNRRPITQETELRSGDEITIGDTRILFNREALPKSSHTVIQVRDILGKSSREKNLIDEVNEALSYDQPLDKFLEHIMNVTARYIPMDRGILMLMEGNPERLVRKVVKVPGSAKETEALGISESIVRTALNRNSAVMISDVQSDEAFSKAQSVIIHKIHSALCVPLWNNQEVIGAIYLDRISVAGPFSEGDLRDLTLLGNVAAVRIKEVELREAERRNELHRKELDWAKATQENLLPKEDPVFPPFDISGSARTCQYVGGDYFDFIGLGPDALGIVIADVSGTGIGAAILMAHLNGALHSGIRATEDLSKLAAELNDDIHQKSEINAFISFFLGIVDRKKSELTYVNAGHNPPLLLDTAGRVQSLRSTGLCLGMFPGASCETKKVTLGPGDLLCLYTDGVVESRNDAGEEFGEERLRDVLKENASLPARGIIEKIYSTVFEFTNNPKPEDDISLIVLKR